MPVVVVAVSMWLIKRLCCLTQAAITPRASSADVKYICLLLSTSGLLSYKWEPDIRADNKATPVAHCNDGRKMRPSLPIYGACCLDSFLSSASHPAEPEVIATLVNKDDFFTELHHPLCIESTSHLYTVTTLFSNHLQFFECGELPIQQFSYRSLAYLWFLRKLYLRLLIDLIECVLWMLLNYRSYTKPSPHPTLLCVLHLSGGQ